MSSAISDADRKALDAFVDLCAGSSPEKRESILKVLLMAYNRGYQSGYMASCEVADNARKNATMGG